MSKCDKDTEIGMIYDQIVESRKDIKKLIGAVSALKVKAGVWGATSGAVSAITAVAVYLAQKKM